MDGEESSGTSEVATKAEDQLDLFGRRTGRVVLRQIVHGEPNRWILIDKRLKKQQASTWTSNQRAYFAVLMGRAFDKANRSQNVDETETPAKHRGNSS